MTDFLHEKLLWENDTYAFYSTDLTRDGTRKLRKMDINGIELRGWSVVKAVSKVEECPSAYVIYDDRGIPFYDSDSMEDIFFRIDIMKFAMVEQNNIVTMAERLAEGRDGSTRPTTDDG